LELPLPAVFFIANMASTMDWITDTIAIGTFLEARSHKLRVDAGIRSIICLDAVLRDPDEPNLDVDEYEVIDLADGPGNEPRVFDQAVRLVGLLSAQSPKLLVHCRAGRSRSVVVVAGYLMRERHWSCDRAIAFIGGRRDIQLTPGIEELLRFT
jgi:protein-tyrosine phosphatase